MIKLFQYQITAVEELHNKLNNQNISNSKRSILYASPTGSGKTVVLSKLVEVLRKNINFNEYTFLFLAPSVGKIYQQSYEKFENLHNNGKCSLLIQKSYLTVDKLEKGRVYFGGWSQFSKQSIVMNHNREQNYVNFMDLMKNTKKKYTKILLIIDEQHTGIGEEYLSLIKNVIKPNKVLEVSATPKTSDIFDNEINKFSNTESPIFRTLIDEVKNENSVKQYLQYNNIIFNTDDEFTKNKEDFILRAGLNKQEEVKKEVSQLNINTKMGNFNPLLLIQLPTQTREINEKETKEVKGNSPKEVENFFEHYGPYISTIKEKKLSFAIWTSKVKKIFKYDVKVDNYIEQNKTDTELKKIITSFDSVIDVLFFKYAIAVGWDVPRANILVKLKDTLKPNIKNNFLVQTVGRVFRNPFISSEFNQEIKTKTIANQLLQSAFVFGLDENVPEDISNYFGGSLFNMKKIPEMEKVYQRDIKFQNELIVSSYNSNSPIVDMTNYSKEIIKKIKDNIKKISLLKLSEKVVFLKDDDLFKRDTRHQLVKQINFEKKQILNKFLTLSMEEEYKNLLNNIFKISNYNETLFLQILVYSEEWLIQFCDILLENKKQSIKGTRENITFNIPLELELFNNWIKDDKNNIYEKWYDQKIPAGKQWKEYKKSSKGQFIHQIFESETGVKLYDYCWEYKNNNKLDYYILHNDRGKINYFIKYFDEQLNKIRSWYPDFIIYNKGKFICLDAKNNDKEETTINKLKEVEHLSTIPAFNHIEFYFTEQNKNNKWIVYNDHKTWTKRHISIHNNKYLEEILSR